MMTEQTLKMDSREFKKLECVARMLELESKHNAEYEVRDVYFDYGANWMWTTIVRTHDWMECQVLSPRQWRMIMDCETGADLVKVVDDIRNGEYFND